MATLVYRIMGRNINKYFYISVDNISLTSIEVSSLDYFKINKIIFTSIGAYIHVFFAFLTFRSLWQLDFMGQALERDQKIHDLWLLCS